MGIRAAIQKLPPVYAAAIVGLLLVLAGWRVWSSLRRPPVPGMSLTRQLVCTKCGHVSTATNEQIARQVTVDASDVAWPALSCPSCGANALRLARKCPHDGEVFYWYTGEQAGSTGRPQGKCPKCGWDPAVEERERLSKITSGQ